MSKELLAIDADLHLSILRNIAEQADCRHQPFFPRQPARK